MCESSKDEINLMLLTSSFYIYQTFIERSSPTDTKILLSLAKSKLQTVD